MLTSSSHLLASVRQPLSLLTHQHAANITGSTLRCCAGGQKNGEQHRRSPIRALGGPLKVTRLLRALQPVGSAHRSQSGRIGGANTTAATAQHTRSPATSRHPAWRAKPLSRIGSLTVDELPPWQPRDPDFPLDSLPVYPASDLNGPANARASSYEPMHSLSQMQALPLYMRDHRSGRTDGESPWDGEGGGHRGSAAWRTPNSNVNTTHGKNRSDAHRLLFCRLCNVELEPGEVPLTHMGHTATGNPLSHVVREVALDTVALLGIRGYPVDDVLTVWAETLFRCPCLPRIEGLSDPRWSIEKRASRLGDVMSGLRKAGVIDTSLARAEAAVVIGQGERELLMATRRREGFERLEYIGDACWSRGLTQRLILLYPTQQWLYGKRSVMLNTIRDACEMNTNLDFAFDTLRIAELLPSAADEDLGTGKLKADYVEALVGELHIYAMSWEPCLDDDVAYVEPNAAREAQMCAVVQHCLTELFDLVVLQHARRLLQTAIPLGKEVAARHLWLPITPPLAAGRRSTRRLPLTMKGGLSTVAAAAAALADELPEDAAAAAAAAVVVADGTDEPACIDGTVNDSDPNPSSAFALPSDVAMSAGSTVPKTEEGVCSSAAAASLPGVVGLPVLGSISSGLLASLRFGYARLLPGRFRLHGSPRPYPDHVLHPLRRLPLSSLFAPTVCEHTKADLFTDIIASYHRLGLLHENTRQMRYVVSRRQPLWSELIVLLVPQLGYGLGMNDEVVSVDKSDEEEKDDDDAVGAALASSTADDAAAAAVRPGAESEPATASATSRPVVALLDERQLYHRDSFYALSPLPTARPATVRSSASLSSASPPPSSPAAAAAATQEYTVEWVLSHTGLPKLTPKPTQGSDGSELAGVSGGSGSGSVGPLSVFASSLLVPPGTRTPPAGVVTDRNLHRGVFAFLAYGVEDPIGEARKACGGDLKGTGMVTQVVKKKEREDEEGKGEESGDAAAVDVDDVYRAEVEAAFKYWKRKVATQPRSFLKLGVGEAAEGS